MSKLLDTILTSNQLKKIIVERSFKYQIPIRYLCDECGVDYKMFMSTYINSTSGDAKHVSEDQFVKMLSILGIDVRFQFVINKSYNIEEVSKGLSEKYEKKRGPSFNKKLC